MEKFRAWVQKHISGDGTSRDFSQNLSKEKNEGNNFPWMEVPDVPPDAPAPGEDPVKFGAEFFGGILQGLGINALIGVFKHILEKEDKTKGK